MTENQNDKQNLTSNQNQTSPTITEAYRLIIKNIPEKISNEILLDTLKKNFENKISDISINKLKHKYNNYKNKKICLISAESLNTRKKIIDFFSTNEFIDPKGGKHKFTVVDNLYQMPIVKSNEKIENTISSFDHFLKFKEFFEQGKPFEFKNEEEKCKKNKLKYKDININYKIFFNQQLAYIFIIFFYLISLISKDSQALFEGIEELPVKSEKSKNSKLIITLNIYYLIIIFINFVNPILFYRKF